MRIRRALAVAGVTAALSTGLAATPATAADAAAVTCSWPKPTNTGYTYHEVNDEGPIRKGPYGVCDPVGTGWQGGALQLVCYAANDYGNTWSYVRGIGWMFDDYFDDGGSQERCTY
ncbi:MULTISPECIES: hypothetical protein [unclassified Streptomyces]|uniref:hypothetical protein n=1 Tax=unclassified Streptomyces TaxID=2593676 RepID=UPI00365EEA66